MGPQLVLQSLDVSRHCRGAHAEDFPGLGGTYRACDATRKNPELSQNRPLRITGSINADFRSPSCTDLETA